MTDAQGTYQFTSVPEAQRYVINYRLDGYGEYSQVVYAGQTVETVYLLPVDQFAQFDPDAAFSLDVTVPHQQANITVVSLPAGSLVHENGLPVSGMVQGSVTLIDPSANVSLMPGNFTTVIEGSGDIAPIESFGAVDIVFKDEQGNRLQLAQGQTATIQIPIASGQNPFTAPDTIPLYYFDTQSGHWVEEGTATKQFVNSAFYYEGQVSHFTTWNADQVYNTTYIHGCVNNRFGEFVEDARISATGVDYIGASYAITDANGQFRIPVKRSSQLLLAATTIGLSSLIDIDVDNLAAVSPGSDEKVLNSCLVLALSDAQIKLSWDRYPEDMDVHLYGPKDSAGLEQFHVYYGNKTVTLNNTLIAQDRDDTDSYGPEIINISGFPYPGTYSFYVHEYHSSQPPVFPPLVNLNLGNLSRSFRADLSTKGNNTCWHVFDLEVDDSMDVEIVSKMIWSNSDKCD